MGLWTRRLVALVAVAAVLLLSPLGSARAETTSPAPPATASATVTPTAEPDDTVDTPDVPLDDTRTTLVLVGAGVLALLAGLVVFLRR